MSQRNDSTNKLKTRKGFVWAKLFRRELVLSGGVTFDETLSFCEDQHFVVQYLCVPDVKQICFNSNLKIYKYFVRTGSLMASLRKGYNPKFFTDFLAYQKIASLLHARYNDVTIDELATHNICWSGYRILRMMYNHKAQNKEQKSYIEETLNVLDANHQFKHQYYLSSVNTSLRILREHLRESSKQEKAESVNRWFHSNDCCFRYLSKKWKMIYILSVFAGKRGLELVGNKI